MLIISYRSKGSLCGCISNENLVFFLYPAQFVRQSPLELIWRSSASYGQHATILFVPVVHLQSLTRQCSLQPFLCRTVAPGKTMSSAHPREFLCIFMRACLLASMLGGVLLCLLACQLIFVLPCFLAWQLHDCLLTCLLACLFACLLACQLAHLLACLLN